MSDSDAVKEVLAQPGPPVLEDDEREREGEKHGPEAYGAASARAVHDFDAIAGDSEHSVDYPPGIGGVESTVEIPGEVGQLSYGGFQLPPSLDVELVVSTPDGRSYSFRESIEIDEPVARTQITEAIEAVTGTALFRFGSLGS